VLAAAPCAVERTPKLRKSLGEPGHNSGYRQRYDDNFSMGSMPANRSGRCFAPQG